MGTRSASLVGRTSSIIRRRGVVLFGLSFWPFALTLIALVLLTTASAPPSAFWDPIQLWKSMSWLMRCSVIVEYISHVYLAPMLAVAGISEIVSADQKGTELSFGDAFLRV